MFDPTPYRTHQRTLAWLQPRERVLEVGCSSGAPTERIQARGCVVVGLERREEAADRARRFCEKVFVGDVERIAPELPRGDFDVLLLLDVLEHLVDPVGTARQLIPCLRPTGRVIVALPNIAHWSIRVRLLQGRFDSEDSGILDRTHLHFYTVETARQLILALGLEILEEDIVPDVPLLRYKDRLVRLNYKVARLWPNLFATESLFVARPMRMSSFP